MQKADTGSVPLKARPADGLPASLIRNLERASRHLQVRLERQSRQDVRFIGIPVGRKSGLRVLDAAWIIQGCLNAADAVRSDTHQGSLRDQAHRHLAALAAQARDSASLDKAEWRGMGWGRLLQSAVPLRYETAVLGDMFLRVAGQIDASWPLDTAKSVHVLLSANPGRLFEEGDQFCLSNGIDGRAGQACLAVSAMCAAFSARLFHHLAFDEGDAGFAFRLMRGVVDRQCDQGNWPLQWSADGGHGEQGLIEHAAVLRALADYMTVRGSEYELNYRYGIQWLLAALSKENRKRFRPEESAASVLALTRAQQYWAREADDVDFTLAAACGEKAGRMAAAFRKPAWRRPGLKSSIVLAAEAQRVRYQMWFAAEAR